MKGPDPTEEEKRLRIPRQRFNKPSNSRCTVHTTAKCPSTFSMAPVLSKQPKKNPSHKKAMSTLSLRPNLNPCRPLHMNALQTQRKRTRRASTATSERAEPPACPAGSGGSRHRDSRRDRRRACTCACSRSGPAPKRQTRRRRRRGGGETGEGEGIGRASGARRLSGRVSYVVARRRRRQIECGARDRVVSPARFGLCHCH